MLLLSTQMVLAQSCLPGGITFTSQVQVDSFQVNYPGCVEIEGSVFILGGGITNLSGLNQLEIIGGDLRIGSSGLLDLQGLNNLTHISGSLQVHGNDLLKKLDGLESLDEVGGGLAIKYNPVLNSLSGVSNLGSIDGLYIEYNDNLQSLNGLQNLSGSVFDIQVFGNDVLSDLTSLNGLTGVNRYLEFIENPALQSLDGIENLLIEAYLVTIADNYNLSHCAVKSICDYLDTPHPGWWTIDIRVNDEGCNSVEEVEDSCDVIIGVDEQLIQNALVLYPNPSTGIFTIKYSISDPSTTLGTGSRYSIFELYDMHGIKVRSLFNEMQPAGEYVLTFDVSDFPAGMYVVEMRVGESVIRKKLLVE